VFNVFKVGKCVQVSNSVLVSVEFTMLRVFNALGHTMNSQNLQVCNLKVIRMV